MIHADDDGELARWKSFTGKHYDVVFTLRARSSSGETCALLESFGFF
jgi:hypothetical protein